MLSTLASFNLVNNNLQATLKRTAADPVVTRDAQYYKDNIGKVTSVDDFLDNYQLFSYAMKAYGLEDMTYAKAFMKKVMESDLSDSNSFANQLTDSRYKQFAEAFNFNTDGSVKTTTFDAQSGTQEDDTIGLYSQAVQNRLSSIDDDTTYYQTTIAKVSSVDDFLSDQKLVDYALKANGIDPTYYSTDTLKKVLTSDLSDPSSYANQLGSDFVALAKSFNFQTDGSLAAGTSAQSDDALKTTVADYDYYEAGTTTPLMAQANTDYFTQTIGSITSVDQLMSDSRLYSYVLTAFGFSPSTTDSSTIEQALTSDPDDPSSYANTATGGDYADLAKMFNFNADGTVPAGEQAISGANLTTVTDDYATAYSTAVQSSIDSATSYYKTASAQVTSVKDLMSDTQLYDYVLDAYGLDPETTSAFTVQKVLESDPSDPNSYVSSLHDSRYSQLAAAFNFDAGGNAVAPRAAQSTSDLQNTETAYAALATAGTITKDQAKTETTYYDGAIQKIANVDDFLSDSRLVNYALLANGIDPKSVTTSELKQALTSDLNDPTSYANTEAGTQLRDLAATFNFGTDGSIKQETVSAPQSMLNIVKTGDLYTRQTLEENEGDENTGVRLALYFEREAPNITSAYDILADSALLQVVQTALGISPDTSAADVDIQANYIDSRIDVKDFQDPDKLNKFLAQFASMYDLDQNDPTTDPTVTLISGSTASNGVSADLLLSIAQLGN